MINMNDESSESLCADGHTQIYICLPQNNWLRAKTLGTWVEMLLPPPPALLLAYLPALPDLITCFYLKAKRLNWQQGHCPILLLMVRRGGRKNRISLDKHAVPTLSTVGGLVGGVGTRPCVLIRIRNSQMTISIMSPGCIALALSPRRECRGTRASVCTSMPEISGSFSLKTEPSKVTAIPVT